MMRANLLSLFKFVKNKLTNCFIASFKNGKILNTCFIIYSKYGTSAGITEIYVYKDLTLDMSGLSGNKTEYASYGTIVYEQYLSFRHWLKSESRINRH